MRSLQAVISLCIVILALFLQPAQAEAQSSSEPAESIDFMCRTKAKEIAAETYSTCVHDNKQAEIERIRQDYQAELAQIKAKYDSEIKGLTTRSTHSGVENSNTAPTNSAPVQKKTVPINKGIKTVKPAKVEARAVKSKKMLVVDSAPFKDMPAKKLKTSKVKVERIDFSNSQDIAPSAEITSDSQTTMPLQSRLGSDSNLSQPEIVEIPIQEE